jgi:hypothetical protein
VREPERNQTFAMSYAVRLGECRRTNRLQGPSEKQWEPGSERFVIDRKARLSYTTANCTRHRWQIYTALG